MKTEHLWGAITGAELTSNQKEKAKTEYQLLMKRLNELEAKAGQHETIVIALEKRRKQFEDTYVKESDNGNFMNADKAGFYEECYRNVIKDLKECH